MPTASEHLSQYGVTVEQARSFILGNLNNLPNIINVCSQFGVTNEMLAEIYGGGITANTVIAYFNANSVDSTVLDTSTDNTDDSTPDDSSSANTQSLVGTWFAQDLSDGIGTQQLVFNSDNTFTSTDFNSALQPGEINGSESGTYSWDQSTGILTTQVTNDENGTLGLNTGAAITINFGSSTDSFTMLDGGETFNFAKVTESSASSIVGNWYIQEQNLGTNTVYFSIFEDGTYAWSEDVATPSTGESDGIEQGSYTWDASTGLFTPQVSSDSNGTLGFSGTTSTWISSNTADSLTVTMDGETFSFIPATNAAAPTSTNLSFTADELEGQMLYNVFKDDPNDPWKVVTFEFFDNGTLNAEDGIVDNPDQFMALPYEITEQGYLKYYLDTEEERSLDVVAKITDNTSNSMVSWININNPENGFNTPLPESMIAQHQYNQSIGSSADTQEYFFYNLSDAQLFIA